MYAIHRILTPNGQSMVDDDLDGLQVVIVGGLGALDSSVGVLKIEQRFTALHVTADTAVKSAPGFLHSLTFAQTDAAPTAGSIIVYDNTAESGTILYSETFTADVFRGYTVTLDVSFSVGLYVGFTTTADVGVTVSYR